jgi:hypothetical protein
LTVKVLFSSPIAQTFEVKAEQPRHPNLCGSIDPFQIQTTPGTNTEATVRLNAPMLTDAEKPYIHAQHDSWNWFARPVGAQDWIWIAKTAHKAYTVLGPPTEPWSTQDPAKFAWTLALDLACDWARGAATIPEVTGEITRDFFQLGDPAATHRLTYSGHSHHISGLNRKFHLQDMIGYIANGASAFNSVSCQDVTAAVVSLANLLGASLQQQIIGTGTAEFTTNRIVPIGQRAQAVAFGSHEFACVPDTSDAALLVWDGCLLVQDPAATQDSFLTAAAMPFASQGLGYLSRLVSSQAVGNIRTFDSAIRPLGARPRAAIPIAPRGVLSRDSVSRMLFEGRFNDFQPPLSSVDYPAPGVAEYFSTLRDDDDMEPIASVSWFRCASVARAKEVFDELRTLFSVSTRPAEYGDECYAAADGSGTVFRVANIVLRIFPATGKADKVSEVTEALSATLREAAEGGELIP